tara:strand:- start:360 stop:794 length:435 start_codon:yes stop_codon:yes gene_type:complete
LAVYKWLVIGAVVFSVLIIGTVIYNLLVVNRQVAEEVTSNPDGERAGIVTLLTLPDGKQIPVNYLQEEDKVFLGADGPWWRVFRNGGADVILLIRGRSLKGNAVVVLDDPEYTHEVFARLRPKAPAWLPDWLNGKLIVISLESS